MTSSSKIFTVTPSLQQGIDLLNNLDDKKVEYEIVEYLKDVPTKDELTNIIKMLGILPEGLVRKGEPDFKENFKGRELTNNEWIDAMIRFPKLIERPIVVSGNRAVLGRPPENVLELL